MKNLAAGFRALSHGKLILLLALTTAALGVLGAAPLGPALWKTMAGTLAGDHFLRNHPTFAPSDFFDFLVHEKDAIGASRFSSRIAAFLSVAIQMFFAGGIIAVLGRGPFSFGQFFEPARRNFWHNVKCFLVFLVLVLVVFTTLVAGSAALLDRVFQETPPDAAIRSVAGWTGIALAVVLWGVVSLLYDFARAARRFAPLTGALRGYRFALRVLRGSWLAALGLFLFWFVTGALVVGAGLAVAWLMPAVSPPAIALLFLVQFGVFWLRSAVRVACWGSYIEFLQSRSRDAVASLAKARIVIAAPSPSLGRVGRASVFSPNADFARGARSLPK